MAKNVVINEAEISKCINAIQSYADFLIMTIEKYNDELQELQNGGIQDEVIRAQIGELAEEVTSYKNMLSEIITHMSPIVQEGLEAITYIDNFTFPESEMNAVESIINQLI